jgi:hypothetical protein
VVHLLERRRQVGQRFDPVAGDLHLLLGPRESHVGDEGRADGVRERGSDAERGEASIFFAVCFMNGTPNYV